MAEEARELTIGPLARTAGVGVETVRFYQRKGLLPQPERPYGGVRRYGAREVTRLRFIKAAQRIGFTLEEIRQLLRLEDGTQCEDARTIAQHKLTDLRARIAELRQIEAVLDGLVRRCAATEGETTRCPIISALKTADESQLTAARERTPPGRLRRYLNEKPRNRSSLLNTPKSL